MSSPPTTTCAGPGDKEVTALGFDDLRREHFELPSLRPVTEEIRCEIEDGRGFVLLRRLPVEDYPKDEISMIFLGDRYASWARAVAERSRRPACARQGFQPRRPAGARLPQQAGAVAAHRLCRPRRARLFAQHQDWRHLSAHQRAYGP